MVSTHFTNPHEPTVIELETLKSYSIVASEHAYRLLGSEMLGTKAEQMNDALYESVLGPVTL
jgi:hypothetical protein